MANRNSETLADFTAYCAAHPDERFWQALRSWSGYHLIMVSNDSDVIGSPGLEDTFYWEGKTRDHAPAN